MEPRTRSIRLALAFLWWVAPKKDRRPFHNFWIAMAMTNDAARQANLSASLNAIYLPLGRDRGLEAAARVEHGGSWRIFRNSESRRVDQL